MSKIIKYLEQTLEDIDHQLENDYGVVLRDELLEMREEISKKLENMR